MILEHHEELCSNLKPCHLNIPEVNFVYHCGFLAQSWAGCVSTEATHGSTA